jgi:hypothetical protein
MIAKPFLPCVIVACLLAPGALTSAAHAQSDDSAFTSLDDADQTARMGALRLVLDGPVNGERRWSNIDSGHSGILTAASDLVQGDGKICRKIIETLRDGIGSAKGSTTACRPPAGGQWTIVKSSMSPIAAVPADLPPQPDDGSAGPAYATPGQPQVPVQVYIDGNKYLNQGQGKTRTTP